MLHALLMHSSHCVDVWRKSIGSKKTCSSSTSTDGRMRKEN